MSFLPEPTKNTIQGVGPPKAKLMIVGDCPSGPAIRDRKPFTNPLEGVLETCLHQAGMVKSETFITNLIPDDSNIEKYWKEGKDANHSRPIVDLTPYRAEIDKRINEGKPRVLVTLGQMSSFAFTGKPQITEIRGYPYPYDAGEWKVIVIPTFHPNKMVWSNYIWRYYMAHDLRKAKTLSENPRLLYEPKIEIILPTGFSHAMALLNSASVMPCLSVDIEVSNYEVSCVGFATSVEQAFSIPFDMRWTLEEEVALWNRVSDILEDPKIAKIGQNFIFDIYFLAYRVGIITRGYIIDTMMSHSLLYPEFRKSLNFLASIHTYQARWKDMVKFKNIKEDS